MTCANWNFRSRKKSKWFWLISANRLLLNRKQFHSILNWWFSWTLFLQEQRLRWKWMQANLSLMMKDASTSKKHVIPWSTRKKSFQSISVWVMNLICLLSPVQTPAARLFPWRQSVCSLSWDNPVFTFQLWTAVNLLSSTKFMLTSVMSRVLNSH